MFYNLLKMTVVVEVLKKYLYVSWIGRYNNHEEKINSSQLFNKVGILLTGVSQETINSFLNLESNIENSMHQVNELSKLFYQHPDISLTNLIKIFGFKNVQKSIEAVINFNENFDFDKSLVSLPNFTLMDIPVFKYISDMLKIIDIGYMMYYTLRPKKDTFSSLQELEQELEPLIRDLYELMNFLKYYDYFFTDNETIESIASKSASMFLKNIKIYQNGYMKIETLEEFEHFSVLHIIAAYRGLDKVTLALTDVGICDNMIDTAISICDSMVNTVRWYDKQTPLMIAINGGHKKIALILIKAGARLDETDIDGETALNYAVRKKDYDVVKALIQAGADVTKKWYDGSDALTIAQHIKAFDIRDLLAHYKKSQESFINDLSTINKNLDESYPLNKTLYQNENYSVEDILQISKSYFSLSDINSKISKSYDNDLPDFCIAGLESFLAQ